MAVFRIKQGVLMIRSGSELAEEIACPACEERYELAEVFHNRHNMLYLHSNQYDFHVGPGRPSIYF